MVHTSGEEKDRKILKISQLRLHFTVTKDVGQNENCQILLVCQQSMLFLFPEVKEV